MLLRVALLAAFAINVSLANDHQGKAFSLFNVVTFKNVDCVSTSSSSSSGARNGTCYTSEECSEKGGKAAGGCAMGFGTCCLFAYEECGKDIEQNCSYVRNEGFPTAISKASMCTYKIKKCDEAVCTLRLDFDSFTLLAGTGSIDSLQVCQDSFTVTGLANGNPNIPTICGTNTGEHIFVELGTGSSDGATLNFEFGSAAGNRGFEVKVTQYACNSPMRPPEGCLQYHTGTEGRLMSFNFAGDSAHLQNQQYNICLRQEAGFCCVEYSVCADTNSYSLFVTKEGGMEQSEATTACSADYLTIEGGSPICNSPSSVNKFCGGQFAAEKEVKTGHEVICSCTAPFRVGIKTDAGGMDAMMKAQDDPDVKLPSRGLCLNYVQTPCN